MVSIMTEVISSDAELSAIVADLRASTDLFFLFVCALLVLLMQAGFAMYEVGTIDRTNSEIILLKNIIDAAIAILVWFIIGNTVAGEGNALIGSKFGPLLTGEVYNGEDPSLALMRFIFSASFAATTVTVMSGAVADRVPYALYATYAVVTSTFTYPVVAHWAWSKDGWASPYTGNIGGCGVLDFAGSGVVHAFAGAATFVWAYLLEPRAGRFHKLNGRVERVNFGDDSGFSKQNRTLQALGVFLLWLGWRSVLRQYPPGGRRFIAGGISLHYLVVIAGLGAYDYATGRQMGEKCLTAYYAQYGFNCGSTGSISSQTSREIVSVVAVNTTIAPVVCCLTSMAIETLHHREIIPSKHWFRLDGNAIGSGRDCEQEDLHSAAINGILSGLVSITAGCATTNYSATIGIAIVAAFIYHFTYRSFLRYGIDDAVNAVAVHFWCGLWGLLSAGLLYEETLHNTLTSFYGVAPGECQRQYQIAANIIFMSASVLWSAFIATLLFYSLDYLLRRIWPNALKTRESVKRFAVMNPMIDLPIMPNRGALGNIPNTFINGTSPTT